MNKADLIRIQHLSGEIECLMGELERIKGYYSVLRPVRYDGVKVNGGGTSDPTAEIVIKTLEKVERLESLINSKIDYLCDLKARAVNAIGRLEDSRYRLVLELRYLEGWSWEDIAKRMHYSLRRVFYLHGDALRALEKSVQ